MPIVPHRFLFRFTIGVRRVEPAASTASPFLDLRQSAALPDFGALDDVTPFAQLRAGWNEHGLGFRVDVSGKKMPLVRVPGQPHESDGFQLWLDTRNTQSIHRAGRFCHHFVLLPAFGDTTGRKAEALQLPIAMAKEDAPANRANLLRVHSQPAPRGYVLEAWIPSECLHGYDPESNPLLGFYYVVRDAELGEQFHAVGREFPYDHDPSLWSTLELTRG